MKVKLTTTFNTNQEPTLTKDTEPYYRYQFCISSKKLGEGVCTDQITNSPILAQLALIATLKGSIPKYNLTINPEFTKEFYKDPAADCLCYGNTPETYNELLNLVNTYHITQNDLFELYDQLNKENLLDTLYWTEPEDETFELSIQFN